MNGPAASPPAADPAAPVPTFAGMPRTVLVTGISGNLGRALAKLLHTETHVVGAEEQAPALFDLKPVARLLSFPALPITPTVLPFPLPSRYHIHIGEPMTFQGAPDEDDEQLERKVTEVESAVRALIARGLAERRHVFW